MGRTWHPGWAGWFTWGGYRGRLSYLGASILVGLAVGAVATALAIFAALLAGLAAFVCILAQRMRDIGMPVVPCLAAYAIASLLASAAVAMQQAGETAAIWNPDFPLWLNLLQLALTVFALALVIVPGNAWLDEE